MVVLALREVFYNIGNSLAHLEGVRSVSIPIKLLDYTK